MRNFTPVLLSIFLLSCGSEGFSPESDSIVKADHQLDSIAAADSVETFSDLYSMLVKFTDTLVIPSTIDCDSVDQYKHISVTPDEAAKLWPPKSELPGNAEIYAFAQSHPEAGTTGIWYYVRSGPPAEEDGPVTEDVYLVLYKDDSLPTDVCKFASMGPGECFTRVSANDEFVTASIEEQENITVTCAYISVESAAFTSGSQFIRTFSLLPDGRRESLRFALDCIHNRLDSLP